LIEDLEKRFNLYPFVVGLLQEIVNLSEVIGIVLHLQICLFQAVETFGTGSHYIESQILGQGQITGGKSGGEHMVYLAGWSSAAAIPVRDFY
jgi:hypothetical protein